MHPRVFATFLTVLIPLASALSAPGASTFAAPSSAPRTSAISERAWIFFADHGFTARAQERAAIDAARRELPARTLARRAKVHADVDLLDVPPAVSYVAAVQATGARIRVVSRWLNAVSVEADAAQIAAIEVLPFVAEVRPVASRPNRPRLAEPVVPVDVRAGSTAPPVSLRGLDYGDCASQIIPIQVDQLHAAGFTGAGVLVCMLDTGFLRTHVSLDAVNVVAEHDFVQNDGVTSNQAGDDPGQHNHGTYTLSLIGGFDPGHLIGPAFGASFALGKTETISSETPIEEDWWVAGAEWADSLGADVISSSLGYKDWYTYPDMDGNTAVVTIGADLAVANGICVFNSAGNEGSNPWLHIIAPADGDSVVAVGAVDSLGTIASFSSRGPSADGRFKPDVCAMGQGNIVAMPSDDAGYLRGSGTSFSCPMAAGVAALLLDAHPSWTPMQVRQALRSTASRATNPDNNYGWGIIRGMAAATFATSAPVVAAGAPRSMWASPNPSRDITTLRFDFPRGTRWAEMAVHDVAGRQVRWLRIATEDGVGSATWDGRDDEGALVSAGVYYARLLTDQGATTARIVRLR